MFGDLIPLAVTLQSAKGCMALLVGSGISRASGIPTGWDITLDLARRVAEVEREVPGTDIVSWYSAKYGAKPNYADLLGRLTGTGPTRQALLRSFFEPSEEERDAGLKEPSAAHRAIADLVQSKAIRIIVTTNFDRLLERALQDVGIAPTVITNDDGHRGAAPLPHTPCTVIKVHGDYLDTRIKNSPDELATYEPGVNTLLNRIFGDYGLIVCGWSAEYDTALRASIESAPPSPYPTYWLSHGTLGTSAQGLIAQRHAVVVPIDRAERFLPDLADRVTALDDLAGKTPVTVKSAVATAKRFMAEPRFDIRLHDFLLEQFNFAAKTAEQEGLITGRGPTTVQELQKRITRFEQIMAAPCALLATGAYWGHTNRAFYLRFERFWNLCPARPDGNSHLLNLTAYPAVLAFYAIGVGCVLSGHYELLSWAVAFTEANPRVWPFNASGKPSIDALIPSGLLPFCDFRNFAEGQQVVDVDTRPPTNGRIYNATREFLTGYATSESQFIRSFDRFELLVSMLHADLRIRIRNAGGDALDWVPLGLFMFRNNIIGYQAADDAMILLSNDLDTEGTSYRGLQAGLFAGSLERIKAALENVKQITARVRTSL